MTLEQLRGLTLGEIERLAHTEHDTVLIAVMEKVDAAIADALDFISDADTAKDARDYLLTYHGWRA